LRSYASLLIQIRSPTRIVGRIDPLGTSFQSATTDRNGAMIATTISNGFTHCRQNSRSFFLMLTLDISSLKLAHVSQIPFANEKCRMLIARPSLPLAEMQWSSYPRAMTHDADGGTRSVVSEPMRLRRSEALQRTALMVMTALLLSIAHLAKVCAETETIDLKSLAKKARPAVLLLVVSDLNRIAC
jgi:hypothetical protein